MSNRVGSRFGAASAIGTLLSSVLATVLVLGHPASGSDEATAGTLAWLGCWRLAAVDQDDVLESADASRLLCLEPGDVPRSLELRAIVDGQVVAEEMLVADGGRHPVSEGGCTGWKRYMLSADQQRLYLQAETTCEGGNQSSLSGASLILQGDRWVDINVTRVDGEREMVVLHYRNADPAAGLLPGAMPTAGSTARVVAAAPLEVEDVIEALAYLDPTVVEALLVESRSSFPMDSRLLRRLDDTGVPRQIIDLMMALSYPEYFAVVDGTIQTRSVVSVGYDYYWTPWFHGYGYGYWLPPHVPNPRPRPRGRAISGLGYTRVRPVNLPSGAVSLGGDGTGSGGSTGGSTGGAVSSGPSVGSGGSASSSGYQGGSSTSTGTAVPR